MACVDCHADLAKLIEFPHADTLAKVDCGSCHDDIAVEVSRQHSRDGAGKAGLNVAPACADCHGTHDITPEATERAAAHAQVPATCGSCHEGISEHYDAGIHAAALKKGNADGADVRRLPHRARDLSAPTPTRGGWT